MNSLKTSRFSAAIFLALTLFTLQSLFTDAYGRRYPADFRWRTFTSGNVEVFYPSDYAGYARYLAFTSHVYADSLDHWYGHTPDEVRVVLNPEQDLTRAMAIIDPNRIEVPLAPALDKGLRPQGSLYLERVTAHELTHVYHMTLRRGFMRWLEPFFGEAIAPAALTPDWVLEGQSIYTESAGGGGRLNSSYSSMLFRTELAQTGNVWSLDRLAVPGYVHPPANRAYIGGAYIYGTLASEFSGYKQLRSWMNKQAAWPGLTGWNFRRAYNGRTISEVYTAIEQAWRSQLRDLISRRQRDNFAVGRRLLEDKRTSYRYPVWTDDGHLVVAEDSYDRTPRLIQLSGLAFEDVERYALRGGAAHDGITAFHEDVIVSEMRRGRWAPEREVSWLVRVTAGGDHLELRDGGLRGWAPAYSAETQQLAYVAPAPNTGLGLWTARLDENGRIDGDPELRLATGLGLLSDPAFSRDGHFLAFVADLGNNEQVYVLDLETSRLRRVRMVQALATWDPSFSPKGSLWLSADVDGIFDLFEVDIDSAMALRRTRVITGAVEPSVSPDGKQVAYSHYTNQGFSLALLDSTRWLADPAQVIVEPVDPEIIAASDTLLAQPIFGTETGYSPLRYMGPNYATPSMRDDDELAFGISIHGRDPVGLLSWRLTARMGIESIEPDLGANLTFRNLPFDVSAGAVTYPEETVEFSGTYDNEGNVSSVSSDVTWVRNWDYGVTAYQPIYFDRGPYSSSLTPFAGFVGRVRHSQYSLRRGLEAEDFYGARGGISWVQAYAARRDPVSRNLFALSVNGERSLPDSPLDGDLVEASARKHFPLWDTTVLAFYSATQIQSGQFSYSRTNVRPRGYDDADLPLGQRIGGRILFGGTEFHFPIAYPDHGWPKLGTVFLERVVGSVFAEGSVGWGDVYVPRHPRMLHLDSVEKWLDEGSALAVGGQIGFRGWILYQAQTQFNIGAAYLPHLDDFGYFISVSFPELYSFVDRQIRLDRGR